MKNNLHQAPTKPVGISEVWNNSKYVLIDTRSESECIKGMMPGAKSIPLLSDNERAMIGYLYKKQGQQTAIQKGYELFEPKINAFLEQFQNLGSDKELAIYCARGGMRSRVICAFLTQKGFKVSQITGGYKAFRQWNLKRLDEFRFNHPVILHGRTGVGKTLVLERLENALDLEGLANHRGSMFGGIGKKPVNQKIFEANLLLRLDTLNNDIPIFIEGESRRIGKIVIPSNLFNQMTSAKMILLDASIATRVERTVHEYIDLQPDSIPLIRETIQELKPDLGAKHVQRLLEDFDKRNYSRCFEFILLRYYDKKYNHALRQLTFEKTIFTEDLEKAAAEIEEFSRMNRE